MADEHNSEITLDEISKLIHEISKGNYQYKPNLLNQNNALDEIVNGIRMLGNELQNIKSRFAESDLYYKRIIENTSDLITITDLNGKNLYVSPSVKSLLGYEVDEFKELNIVNLIHPDDSKDFLAEQGKFQKVLIGEIYSAIYQNRIKRKDGIYLWIEANTTVLFDEKGSLTIQTISRDITELKKADLLKLQHTNDLLARTNAVARVGGWELDLITNTSFWSDITKEIHEVDPDFKHGLETGISFFKEGKSREKIRKAVDEALSNGTPFDLELQLITAKGRELWVRTIGQTDFENGKCVRFYGTIQDIDDFKKSQIKIQKSEKSLNRAQHHAKVGSWELDIETNNLVWSQEHYHIFEIDKPVAPENLYQVVRSKIHPDDLDRLDKVMRCGIEYEDHFTFEHRILLNDGNTKYIAGTAEVIRDENKIPVTLCGTVQDITDLKKYELNFRMAKEQAELANRTKSIFLANMSHEIRTPLNGILGSAEILAGRVQDPKLNTFVKHITNAGKTLLALINDILDLSKIEAGKIEIAQARVNVQEFINELSSMFLVSHKSKNLEFHIDISPELPTHILIDQLRLRQILYNLLGNAFKFTEEGSISIVVSPAENDNIIFEVKDTGIGIMADHLTLIFEPFRQQDKQDTTKYGGTGLGLAISSRLAEAMGGEIRLQSERGVGSVFTVTLPYQLAAMDEIDTVINVSETQTIRNQAVVLIAEDNDVNRYVMKEMLEDEGNITVLEAANGEEAVAIAIKEMPDLIFMDLTMPVLSGYRANQTLKSNPATSNIPIIAWSATGLLEEEEKMISEFHSLLRKPTQSSEVKNILSRFFEGSIH